MFGGGFGVVELWYGAGARIVLVRQTRPAENGRGRGARKLPYQGKDNLIEQVSTHSRCAHYRENMWLSFASVFTGYVRWCVLG